MLDFQTNSRCSPLHPTNLPASRIPVEVGAMLPARFLLLSLCLTSICVPPPAPAESRPNALQLASPQEGETIVQAAWKLRHSLFPKPDCSHFVHDIYTRAGFLYEYAASRSIFAGIERFRRVTK